MNRCICRLSLVLGLSVLGGCGSGSNDPSDGAGVVVPDDRRSTLRALGDRDEFFAELRGALAAQRGGDRDPDFAGGEGEATDDTADANTTGGADGAPSTDAPATEGGASGGEEGRLEVTETNVQERGVDEQDRVKVSADGTRLYVLHDRYDEAYGWAEPVIVEDTETGELVEIEPDGRYPGPGGPRTLLRVLGLDAQASAATALRDIELDLGGRGAQGMYLHESGAGSDLLLVSTGGGYWGGYWDQPSSFGGLDSAITRIDVDEPASAAVSGSFRIDGQIVSSRRIGKHLFLASRFYPVIPGPRPWEVSAEEWRTLVEGADLASLLPRYANDDTGETTALVDPAGCFVAPRPPSVEWYTPDIVTLAVIDLDTMELADSECFLGASETLYASPEAVYLATTRWDYGFPGGGAADGGVVIVDDSGANDTGLETDLLPYDPRVETDIHQFDIDGGTLAYRGSGNVRGHLGWDELRKPFRMGAEDGYLRVATVNDTFGSNVSPINLTVLAPDGEGALTRVAELPNAEHPEHIGKPGEQLYASRFLGDRAYLVTFLQTDPLYVVDLADPRAPRLLGELEIEGYSDYLLPIDATHLLGIGRDAVTLDGDGRRGDGERGGFIQGVKLALFDVSEPGAPREVESLVLGQRGTGSNALHDHRGITVQRATDDHPTRVSFGVDVAGAPFPERRPSAAEALNHYSWTHTGLYGFDVHGGDGADIEWRGAMVVERAGDEDGYFGPRYRDDRAVMVNDATYYVHGPEVYVAPWDDLGNPSGPR